MTGKGSGTGGTHTPGPWWIETPVYYETPRSFDGRLDVRADCAVVAQAVEPADARLIAAAPAMLALLREMADAAEIVAGNQAPDRADDDRLDAAIEQARALLATIEGDG